MVCTATAHTDSLIDELVDREVSYVIVEPDGETATDLFDRGREVVHGDPTSMATLSGINVKAPRAVVSDADDEKVFLPRELLGDGLANKVRGTVRTEVDGGVTIGENIEIDEIPTSRGSRLDGGRLTEDGLTSSSARCGAVESKRKPHAM